MYTIKLMPDEDSKDFYGKIHGVFYSLLKAHKLA